LLLLVGSALLLRAALVQRDVEGAREDAASTPGLGEDAERVLLEAVDAFIGLTEDNKESVLNLCWRVSGNPIHECNPSTLREEGEYPHRRVPVQALWMDRLEVSNAQWAACETAGACPERDIDACRFYTIHRYELGVRPPEGLFQSNRPASCVTLDDARAFCAWRNMRLPTADEWERAARAGEDRMQPWGSFWTPALINWGERDLVGFPIPGRLDGAELTAAVDDYPDGATREGVLNLFGNVSEWVEPKDEERAQGRAGIRGSNYTDEVMTARVTRHRSLAADERRTTVGFRCVADAD
jgi:formylglycine-generating enzyme required for sulfatase activity